MISFINILTQNMQLTDEQLDLIVQIVQQIFQISAKLQKSDTVEKLKLRKFNYEELAVHFKDSVTSPLWMCQCCLNINQSMNRCLVCNDKLQEPDVDNYGARLFESTHSYCFNVMEHLHRVYMMIFLLYCSCIQRKSKI